MLKQNSSTKHPTIYVLNAASIAKPHSLEHLHCDLTGYNVDIAFISETHLKSNHINSIMNI